MSRGRPHESWPATGAAASRPAPFRQASRSPA